MGKSIKPFCLAARAVPPVVVFGCGLLVVGIYAADTVPKPPELTTEQKLTFQTALTDFYKQLAIGNNLRAQLLQNQDAQKKAAAALKAACPGEIVGLEMDAAECKLKTPGPPKSDDPAPAAKH